MALKNNWKDLVDGESFVEVDPINRMAHAIIANEENILSVQKSSESIQAENKSQEAKINELSEDLIRFESDAVRLDSKINENEKRITNLEKGIPSDLFLTDSSIAYSKNVPQNALPYAEVRKIGGVTRKCTNLTTAQAVYKNADRYLETVEDGRNCVRMTSGSVIKNTPFVFKENTQYTVSFYTKVYNYDGAMGGNIVLQFWYTDGTSNTLYSSLDETSWTKKTITSEAGKTVSAIGVGPQQYQVYNYIDIDTFMLNEGSTALPYEPYFEGLRSAPVPEVESVGADETVIGTLPIPEAVRPKHGINEEVYDYIDLDAKQSVERVGKVVFDGSADESWEVRQYTNLVAYLASEKFGKIPNRVLCDRFDSFIDMSARPNGTVGIAVEGLSVTAHTFFFGVSGIATNVAEWRAYLAANPITVYYELATPEITDISDLVSEDNFIGVEGNGTITMINQYKYNIPSEIAFMLNEV